MTRASLRVGVLGAGTVGTEVVRAVLGGADRLAAAAGRRLDIAGIAVRDVDAARRRGLPDDLLTDAPAHLVASPDVDVVVELMGGAEPARTLIAAALSAGKPVVTANKQVLAHRGAELERIGRAAGASLRFEAAVGGGIPVLGPLAADLAANEIRRVRGIVNGTTNFILTEMAAGGGTYNDVLRRAQDLGYAEADPSGDVEGRDAINKLVILVRLAFGQWIDPTRIADRPPTIVGGGRPGITGVTSETLDAAATVGLRIRLIGVAERAMAAPTGDALAVGVVPTAVPMDSRLGRTGGVTNRIEVDADPVGRVGFDGLGAGGQATSSAVLGDLVAIARGQGSTWAELPAATAGDGVEARDPFESETRAWFVFIPARDGEATPRVQDREAIDTITTTSAGIAIRTCALTLADARPAIGPTSARRDDPVPIYPIDD